MYDVRVFLKLYVYYRKFIKDFIFLTKSLYNLLKEVKDKKFKLIQMNFFVRNAFKTIKNIMCSDRVLVQLDTSLSFVIEIDALNFD